TLFPYTLIATIALLGIGIYALITSKRFLRAVFSIEILFMAANLLLLSFGRGIDESLLYPDKLAQTFSIFIITIGLVFLIIGTAIDKRLKQSGDSTLLEFNYYVDGIPPKPVAVDSTTDPSEAKEDEKGDEK
ncbi:MAG: NADH-quinone oxidoreductase subunit K, partial [Candidatus Heimdallarchaeota archaeon]